MTNDQVLWTGAGALAIMLAISFADGVLVHLWRERLHARSESRLEHHVHTGRALLFVVLLTTLLASTAGWLVWIGLAALAIDQVLETVDMAIERRSRARTGGLRTDEYLLHGAGITSRAITLAAVIVARPPEAFSHASHASVDLGPIAALAAIALPGTVLVAIVHLVLGAFPRLLPVRALDR